MTSDAFYIKRCLELARLGAGKVSPNPRVGAVVVSAGEIIAEGYHQYFGGPHAEVQALRGLNKEQLSQATLYINLEPCCFTGKTPACSDLILKMGLPRVVIGMVDPNPRVNHCGIDALRKGGVEVKIGVSENQCRELNRSYIKFITTGLPEVILKTAISLDGRIASHSGDSRWITGKTARTFTHSLRAEYDAILVGVGTVLADNPMLNVRHISGRNPLRLILDSRLRTPLNFNVALNQNTLPSIFFTAEDVEADHIIHYINQGCKVVKVPRHNSHYLSLSFILKHLGSLGVTSVLVEGGAAVFTGFIQQELADRLFAVIAPKIIGADGVPVIGNLSLGRMAEVQSWKFRRIKRLGTDVLLDIILKEY